MTKHKRPDNPCCTCKNWKRKKLDFGECSQWDNPKLFYAWDDGSILWMECPFYERKSR